MKHHTAFRLMRSDKISTYSRQKQTHRPHQIMGDIHPACFDCTREDCTASSAKKCKHIKKLEKEKKHENH